MGRVLAVAWGGVLALLIACWTLAGHDVGFLLFGALLVSTALAAVLSAIAVCRLRLASGDEA